MPKSQRLLELLMTVNRKRSFTVGELAREFGVSPRTMLRDLQELSEWGVPLYSEVGPHGGYRVLKERILPPIAFSEEEAVAIFFAIHALRHYSSLPFAAEAASAVSKFYTYMPPDVRERIDQMRNRVDFVTPKRQAESPFLSILLEAAVEQKVLLIEYESREKRSSRHIQPIGIYKRSGLWYCPAYCWQSRDFRVFRCDRIHAAAFAGAEQEPLDLRNVHLANRESQRVIAEQEEIPVYAELTRAGLQMCEAEAWASSLLHTRPDGTGWLAGSIAVSDLDFFAKYFIGLGLEVTVMRSPELLASMRTYLAELTSKYSEKAEGGTDMTNRKQNEAETDFPKLSRPAQQALAQAGYERLEQLATISEAELLKLHGMGPKSVKQLREAMAEKGLAFAAGKGSR